MQMSGKPKLAVYYPAFLGGGAETVGLWMLEALQQQYDLTLFTLATVDFDRLNALYGTSLSVNSITVQSFFTRWLRPVVNVLIANNKHVRLLLFHWLLRHLKAQNDRYHLLISAYNAVDFGKPGLQYVHWIKVLETNAFYNRISNFSIERMKQNHSITNSYTVAEYIQQEYGCTAKVLYPPVVLDTPNLVWEQKENAFICSGRITEAKQPHKVIAILKQVRQQGFDVKLYLTGGGGGAYAWKYQNFVKKLVKENASWVTLYENLSYQDYAQVLAKCRYGIHFKQEPFGISIAEMVKAGAIPFVRDQGGQREIVGEQNHALMFRNEQEAVDQILAVLGNTERQQHLQLALNEQRNLFSTQRFMVEVNNVVAACLETTESSVL
jgi:glycosyltransferase involved in cell wall biosynthesis